MNKTASIKNLTHEEEIELLYQAKKGKTQAERDKATRLLIHYNRPFVKYLIGGYTYSQSEFISSDELVTEGDIAILKAIKEFDLSRAKKCRLASYASSWIDQRRRSATKESQFLPQTMQKRPVFVEAEEDELSEDEKKFS